MKPIFSDIQRLGRYVIVRFRNGGYRVFDEAYLDRLMDFLTKDYTAEDKLNGFTLTDEDTIQNCC